MPLVCLEPIGKRTAVAEVIETLVNVGRIDRRLIRHVELRGRQAVVEVPAGWENRLVQALDGAVVGVVALVGGGGPGAALALGLSMTLLQFAIGTLNDLVDAPRDTVARQDKAIPAGLVSVRVGACVSGPDDATVTDTADELPTPPLLSVARAVSECPPVTVGVQLNEYGDVVSSPSSVAPS